MFTATGSIELVAVTLFSEIRIRIAEEQDGKAHCHYCHRVSLTSARLISISKHQKKYKKREPLAPVNPLFVWVIRSAKGCVLQREQQLEVGLKYGWWCTIVKFPLILYIIADSYGISSMNLLFCFLHYIVPLMWHERFTAVGISCHICANIVARVWHVFLAKRYLVVSKGHLVVS